MKAILCFNIDHDVGVMFIFHLFGKPFNVTDSTLSGNNRLLKFINNSKT